jgi:hypothetical protein
VIDSGAISDLAGFDFAASKVDRALIDHLAQLLKAVLEDQIRWAVFCEGPQAGIRKRYA